MTAKRAVPGEHAELSYAYQSSPAGRTVEVLSEPDAHGMVRVTYAHTFKVSIDDLEFWGEK